VSKEVKVLVVEDEYITAKLIAEYLEKNNYSIVGIAVSIEEALQYLKEEVHLIILDINLNEERDGIWLANHININHNIPFVFLTAYSDKMTISKAIETDPYNYLIKPFQKPELFSTIELAIHKHEKKAKANRKGNLLLKNVDKFDQVSIESILFIESKKNYLFIYTENKEYKYRATIKEFINQLTDSFAQVHRGFIVNIHFIESIDKKKGFLYIKNYTIPISNSFKRSLLDKIRLLKYP